MQCDDLIWQQCQDGFCSFKRKSPTGTFCSNRNNVMGQCRRLFCPLANSVYATVREFGGNVYLYTKSIERAHTPQRMWKKLLLDQDYMKALQQVDETLTEEFNRRLVHRVKQRLTKVYQYLARERKLAKQQQPLLERVHEHAERIERKKAMKAERMAKLEETIQEHLVDRLRNGTYGELYEDLEQLIDEPQEAQINEGEVEELERELVQYVEDDSEDIEEWADRPRRDAADPQATGATPTRPCTTRRSRRARGSTSSTSRRSSPALRSSTNRLTVTKRLS